MGTTTTKSAFQEGFIAGLPFIVVAAPFALLFGVVAIEAGLTVAQAMGFSVVVIAGASQFTAMQLMTENAPIWVVLAAALAVNLRMAMYSASLQPYLGGLPFWKRVLVAYCNVDQTFAVSSAKYEAASDMTLSARYAYFMGVAASIMPVWVGCSWLGATAGASLPESTVFDFALPLLFLSMVGPMLRTVAHMAAAATSIVVALLLSFLPSGIVVLIAGLIAMAVAAEIERRMGR